MAVIGCKGTVLELGVGEAMAPVSQVLSIELPESKCETFEADWLDNTSAGIPYRATGRVEGGELSGELWLDYSLHSVFTSWITDPPGATANPPGAGSVTFPNGSGMTFDVAGIGFGGSVALKDGLKGKFSAKLSGTPEFSVS